MARKRRKLSKDRFWIFHISRGLLVQKVSAGSEIQHESLFLCGPHGSYRQIQLMLWSLKRMRQYNRNVLKLLAIIGRAGRGAELAKMDIADAYKHVIVHPDFWHLLGIHIGDKDRKEFFVEATLPFGHRAACQIFLSLARRLN